MNLPPAFRLFLLSALVLSACGPSSKTQKTVQQAAMDTVFLASLLKTNSAFNAILANNSQYRVQIIYSQIDRDQNNQPHIRDFSFNNNPSLYYYPASTVKLPVSLLALQKLQEMKMAGVDRHTTMITDSAFTGEQQYFNDPTAVDGRPTIDQYIRQILLVSDNDAFNRLYEFLGQEYINNALHKMGYTDAQIIHRLNISLSEEQNRHSNPVKFYDTACKLLYEKPLEKSKMEYAQRNDLLGKGYYAGDKLVESPFDFSKKNRLALAYLHNIVKSIFFPSAVNKSQQFNISENDRMFVQKYMGMLPRESGHPYYDSSFHDDYVKFLFYGSQKTKAEPNIRIFSKSGDAYGFLIDAAYIVDYKNNIEFLLSAVIHCNSDGIYNDDHYDYDSTGLPFMKNLGRMIYDYELKRPRKYKPSLSAISFNYSSGHED